MKRLLTLPVTIILLLFQSAWLALAQIWSNKMRSILTMTGIIIGVASVTAVIASLSGLKAKVLSDFESFGTNNIYINPERPDRGPKKNVSWRIIRFMPEQFEGLLEHCPSVKKIGLGNWGGTHTIRNGDRKLDGIPVIGVEQSYHDVENRPVMLGRSFSTIDEMEGRMVCKIGVDLRDKLQLDRDCIGQAILVGDKTFLIVGVMEKRPKLETPGVGDGGGEDNSNVFIPFRTMFKITREPWIWALAQATTTKVTEEAQAEIRFFLRHTRNIGPGEPDTFRVDSVASFMKKFGEIAMMITLVAGGIVGISLLVGGVGIMNIMLVSVSERTREIGLRKAIGAKKSAILTQFLVEAVVLCFIGGLLGVGAGELITSIIKGINPVMNKTYIPMWAILLSFAFAGTVGIFFGMFPAIKAARLNPIEALRHE